MISFLLNCLNVVRILFSCNKLLSLVSILLNLIVGLFPVALIYFNKLILDAIFAIIDKPNGGEFILHTVWLVVLLNGLLLLRNLISSFQVTIQTLLGSKLQRYMTEKTFDKIYSSDIKYFENPEFYDKLSRASSEAGYRPMMIVHFLVSLVQGIFIFLALLVILFHISQTLVLVLALSIIPTLIMEKRLRLLSFETYQQKTKANRKMGYIGYLFTNISSVRELKIFRLGEYLKAEYRYCFQDNYMLDKSLSWKRTSVLFLSSVVDFTSSVYSYIYALLGVLVKRFSIGDFSFVIQSFSQCQAQVRGIINSIYSLYENQLFINNYFEFQLLPSDIEVGDITTLPKNSRLRKKQFVIPKPIKTLGLNVVSFNYPGFDKRVFKDISFELKAGEVTALIGDNGVGKTTIIKLLCRFYDPTAGAVLLNGRDIRSFELVEYRRRIGVVFQDFTRYYFTAGNNIAFGDPSLIESNSVKSCISPHFSKCDFERIQVKETIITKDEYRRYLESAAGASGADTFINKLPAGYNNSLGRLFENGAELSYGEWQKLGLSRALFGEKEIILLDEPFSHQYHTVLDRFFEYITNLKKDHICLIITHDPAVADRTDKVIELNVK